MEGGFGSLRSLTPATLPPPPCVGCTFPIAPGAASELLPLFRRPPQVERGLNHKESLEAVRQALLLIMLGDERVTRAAKLEQAAIRLG